MAWIVVVFQAKSKTGPWEQGLKYGLDTLQPLVSIGTSFPFTNRIVKEVELAEFQAVFRCEGKVLLLHLQDVFSYHRVIHRKEPIF